MDYVVAAVHMCAIRSSQSPFASLMTIKDCNCFEPNIDLHACPCNQRMRCQGWIAAAAAAFLLTH